jgi:hypothetical protein
MIDSLAKVILIDELNNSKANKVIFLYNFIIQMLILFSDLRNRNKNRSNFSMIIRGRVMIRDSKLETY